MSKPTCSEFALHIHKISGNKEHPDLYTIGIWDGTLLRAICHIQPIECALAALRRTLEETTRPVVVHSA